jgi:hypothetical protein
MTLPDKIFGLFATGLRRFAGQLLVSVAATVCATAIYGHLVSDRNSSPVPPQVVSSVSPVRVTGGAIDVQTLAYYPEHLAALDSLSRFHAVSAQRTAELAGQPSPTRMAALSDTAKARHVVSADVLPPSRPTSLAQLDVLPPRRPAAAPTPAPAPITVAANPAEPTSPRAKIWGVELPRFVPTGASVIDKLASVKDRIGGLMHVSSR